VFALGPLLLAVTLVVLRTKRCHESGVCERHDGSGARARSQPATRSSCRRAFAMSSNAVDWMSKRPSTTSFAFDSLNTTAEQQEPCLTLLSERLFASAQRRAMADAQSADFVFVGIDTYVQATWPTGACWGTKSAWVRSRPWHCNNCYTRPWIYRAAARIDDRLARQREAAPTSEGRQHHCKQRLVVFAPMVAGPEQRLPQRTPPPASPPSSARLTCCRECSSTRPRHEHVAA